MPLVSIVIPCKNEGENILNTVESILGADNLLPYEIVVVDDKSSDHCVQPLSKIRDKRLRILKAPGLGAPGARNFGAEKARGEILVFCDAHVFVGHKWLDTLLKPLLLHECDVVSPAIAPHDNPRNLGYGQYLNSRLEVEWYTSPPATIQEIAVSPGGCQAMFRSAFEKIGGYDRGFKVWGYEDVEISLKAWLFGLKVVVEPRVEILHVFRTRHPYPVQLYHVDYNFLRMAVSHFNFRRYRKALEMVSLHPGNTSIEQDVNGGHAWTQRKEYLKQRVRTDDWYFAKFGIAF